MAIYSRSALARILEGAFAPSHENSHSNISNTFPPLAPYWGDQ